MTKLIFRTYGLYAYTLVVCIKITKRNNKIQKNYCIKLLLPQLRYKIQQQQYITTKKTTDRIYRILCMRLVRYIKMYYYFTRTEVEKTTTKKICWFLKKKLYIKYILEGGYFKFYVVGELCS